MVKTAGRWQMRRKMTAASTATLLAVTFGIFGASGGVSASETSPKDATYSDPQSTDNLPAETLAVMRQQEALQPAVDLLYRQYMGDKKNGFAGLAFEGDGLTLYYKGKLSSAMGSALAGARKYGAVAVKASNYSMTELEAAGAKIHSARKSAGVNDLQSIGYLPDGSGLIVEKMPAAAAQGLARAKDGTARHVTSAEQIVASAAAGVPVQITTAAQSYRFMQGEGCEGGWGACRNDDWSPWNGGGAFETWRGSDVRARCTTGFGVTANGYQRVLTAAHCGTPPDYAYQGISWGGPYTLEAMGPVSNDAYSYDILLINSPGSVYIFDGLPNTKSGKAVTGYGWWVANELVCQSGITSGTVCDLKQRYLQDNKVSCDHRDSDGDCDYWTYGLVRTEQIYGATAAQPGDSGGPVFTLMGSGVRAKGILSAGSGNVMLFQDWATIVNVFNATPRCCV